MWKHLFKVEIYRINKNVVPCNQTVNKTNHGVFHRKVQIYSFYNQSNGIYIKREVASIVFCTNLQSYPSKLQILLELRTKF